MSTITITIPNEFDTEVGNAFDEIISGRTTETKAQWVKKDLINRIKSVVKNKRIRDAEAQAITDDIPIT